MSGFKMLRPASSNLCKSGDHTTRRNSITKYWRNWSMNCPKTTRRPTSAGARAYVSGRPSRPTDGLLNPLAGGLPLHRRHLALRRAFAGTSETGAASLASDFW